MLYRLRLARWYTDESKQGRLADILSDEVLAEAIDIVTAGRREEFTGLRNTASDALLARREVENGALASLINDLASLSSPPPTRVPHQGEWDHLSNPESSTTNP